MSEQRLPFDGYDERTQYFYRKILFMMELNILAVQRGLFDVLLSDTDDIYSWVRFLEALPDLRAQLPWLVWEP